MNKERKISDLSIVEFEGLVKNIAVDAALEVPRTFFKDTCDNCFDRKSKVLGESLTGKDLTDTKDRDHVRGVYEYSERKKKDSELIGKIAITEFVKMCAIAFLVWVGLKVGK